MFAPLLLAAAAAPAAPVPADTNPAPAGPPPWVVHLKADDNTALQLSVQTQVVVKQTVTVAEVVNGQQVLKQVERDVPTLRTNRYGVADLPGTVATADGSPVGPAELARRAKAGVTVLVSADGKAVDRAWLRAVGPDAVVVTSAVLAKAAAAPVQSPGRAPVTTAAPRLTLLTAGPDGTVRVTAQPAAGGRYVSSRMVVLGNGAMPVMLEDDNFPGVPGGRPQVRPLSEIGFDAYDLTGRLVAREEALRRLRAGGLVLTSADSRLPDAAFLRPFCGDLLVLVSGDRLSNPVAGESAPEPARGPGGGVIRQPVAPLPLIQPVPVPALPAAPAVLPAPAVRPALRFAPGALRVAPAVPAAPAPAVPARPAPKE
jgi:hypothetical protein